MGQMYCFEKNVSNILQIFILYNIISIKTVARKVAHAFIIPRNTKEVKNLKFDCMTLWVPFPMPPHIYSSVKKKLRLRFHIDDRRTVSKPRTKHKQNIWSKT